MVLDPLRGKIFYGFFVKKQFDVSRTEVRILKLLSDGNVHTFKEISDKCEVQTTGAVKAQICRLRHKGIKIETIRSVGYILRTELRINGD